MPITLGYANPLSCKVEIEFTAGTWTDVSDDLIEATTQRGRTYELDEVQAGTATVVLENLDGRYTPGLTSGSHYPNIVPRKAIRLTEANSGERLFTGDVSRWTPSSGQGTNDSSVTLTCTDITKRLSGTELRFEAVFAESLLDSPLALYPLNESDGEAAGNRSAFSQPNAQASGEGNVSAGIGVTHDGAQSFGADGILSTSSGTSWTGTQTIAATNLTTITGPRISLPASACPAAGTGITWEFWATFSAFPVKLNGTFFKAVYSGAGAPTVTLRNGAGSALVANLDTASDTAGTTGAADTGVRHHIVITANNTTKKIELFFDGASIGQSSAAASLPTTSPVSCEVGLPIVTSTDGTSVTETVQIEGLATYNSVLSPARIAAHYHAGYDGFAGETETARITRLLTYADSSPSLAFDPDKTTLAGADWDAGVSLWSEITATAASAGGVAFIDRQGDLAYYNRDRWYNATVGTALFTFAESAGTAAESGLEWDSADDLIRNDIAITMRSTSLVASAVDVTSQDAYGKVSYSETSLLQNADEARQRAGFLLAQHKDPTVQIKQVTINPNTMSSKPNLAVLDLMDLIELSELPAASPATSIPYLVQGIGHQISRHARPDGGDTWTVTLNLSPGLTGHYWQVDDPTYSQVDAGYRIAY